MGAVRGSGMASAWAVLERPRHRRTCLRTHRPLARLSRFSGLRAIAGRTHSASGEKVSQALGAPIAFHVCDEPRGNAEFGADAHRDSDAIAAWGRTILRNRSGPSFAAVGFLRE